jgi:hypothetical protein
MGFNSAFKVLIEKRPIEAFGVILNIKYPLRAVILKRASYCNNFYSESTI